MGKKFFIAREIGRAAVLAALLAALMFACSKLALFDTVKGLGTEDATYDWIKQPELAASPLVSGQQFGYSVDVSDNYAVVGAPAESTYTGAVYVFRNTDGANPTNAAWSPMTPKITAADAGTNRAFGYRVRLLDTASKTIVVVSEVLYNANAGAVYVYELSGGNWVVPTALSGTNGRLTAPEGTYRFGEAIAVNSDYIFCCELDTAAGPGKVHIFSTGTFSFVQTLTDGSAGSNRFGAALSATSGFLFAAAPQATNTFAQAGLVYLYQKTTGSPPWSLVKSFGDPSPAQDRFFGASLDADGAKVAVGEPGNNASDPHKVVIFSIVGNQPTWAQTIDSTDTAAEKFGASVGLYGEWLLVGDPLFDGSVQDEGKAYLYRETGGQFAIYPAVLSRSPALSGDNMGYDVAIKGSSLIVGISKEGTSDTGKAFVFEYEKTN